jgi:hypothetical protein
MLAEAGATGDAAARLSTSKNTRAHGEFLVAESTAAEVDRNSASGLRLAVAHAVTSSAKTAGATDWAEE